MFLELHKEITYYKFVPEIIPKYVPKNNSKLLSDDIAIHINMFFW